jgi:putative sigma-54 modulation protein
MIDIKIKGTGIDLPQSVTNYIYDKIGSVVKFLEDLEPKGVLKVDVEIGRTTQHHKSGPVYRAECNLQLPGKLLRAAHEDWDVRRCIDEIKSELHQEVKKYKEKIRPQDSRGQEELRKLRGK